MDPTNPEDQIKMLLGELVITIAKLEAQKAALVRELAEGKKETPVP